MVNEYLNRYAQAMGEGNLDEVAMITRGIFDGLVDDGLIDEEILNEDNLRAILIHDYEGYLLGDFEMDVLVGVLVLLGQEDYAVALDEVIEEDEKEDEIPVTKYGIVKYELDLVNGTKDRQLVKYSFDGLLDVADFLAARLGEKAAECQDIGITPIVTREDLEEALIQSDIASEVIAENIPDDCVAASIIVKTDEDKQNILTADVYAIYEIEQYTSQEF